MMKKGRRILNGLFASVLALAMVFCLQPQAVFAEEFEAGAADELETEAAATSSNIHGHEYSWNWAQQPNSYLYDQGGNIVRVEAISGTVHIETYSGDKNLISEKTVPCELPVFGGFYKGKNALFLVFGQDNEELNDSKEVVRVVKYDNNWNRIAAVSYNGINTSMPFEAASISMAEYKDFLYIRSGHKMYPSKNDGLRHQANMTFCVNTKTMKSVSAAYEVSSLNFGYCSHSFNQFIRVDGDDVIAADHGDAYPRGIQLSFSGKNASDGYVCSDDMPGSDYERWVNQDYKDAVIMSIAGRTGDNSTGTRLGGFEVASSNYLTAVSHVTLNDSFSSNSDWNVSVLVTPKSVFSGDDGYSRSGSEISDTSTKEIKLTTDGNGEKAYTNPYLVKLSDDLFVVMWEIKNGYNYSGQYQAVAINGKGDKISGIATFNGALSDCQPIYADGRIIWYVTENSLPTFYELSVVDAGGQKVIKEGKSASVQIDPTATREFVSRFYTIILGREAEEKGLNSWTSELLSGEKTGADVAAGFTGSPEFINQGNSDSAYVKKLYRAFFDREPDVGGYNQWMSRLATGADRNAVLAGFINSDEFGNLCNKFGIEKGKLDVTGLPGGDDSKVGQFMLVDSTGVDEDKLNEYVERLYTKILGRPGEAKGMDYWRSEILSGNKYDAATAARTGFFTSTEYLAKNKSDDEFITDAYAAFFNRKPDEKGYAYWKEQLSNGNYDRNSMIDVGFGHSTEFKNLLKTYGFKITE